MTLDGIAFGLSALVVGAVGGWVVARWFFGRRDGDDNSRYDDF